MTWPSLVIDRSMPASLQRTVFVLCLATPWLAIAAPNGSELLRGCEQAIADNFQSKVAMMCEWYAHACECTGKRDDLTPVCLPPGIDTATLAEQLIESLTANPQLQSLDATAAAHAGLAPHYPCDKKGE